MNPEALQYSFDLFSKDGYSGSIEDYKSLISTNDEALNYSFNLFEKDGYSGDLNSFKDITIGTDEIKEPVIEGINTQEVEVEKELFNWKPSLSAEEYEALPLMDKERANWEKFKEIELNKQKEEVVKSDVEADTKAFSSIEDIPEYKGLSQDTTIDVDKDGLYNIFIEDENTVTKTPIIGGSSTMAGGFGSSVAQNKRKANKEDMEVLLPTMDALQKEAFKNLQDYGFSNKNALGADTYTISTEQHAIIKNRIYDKFVEKSGIPIDKGSFDFLYNETIVDNKDQVERDYKSNRIRPESTEVSPEFKEMFVLEADKGKSEVELTSDSLKAKQFEITKELNNINNVLIPQAINRTVDKDESSTKRNRQLDDLNKRKIELENDYKDLDKAIEQNATSTKVIGGWMPGDPLSFQGKPRTYKKINEELNSKFFNMQGRSEESTKKLNKVSQNVENTAGVRAQNLINENPALSQREAVEQLFNDELLYLQQFEADGRNSFVNLKFGKAQLSGGNPMGAKVLRALDANGLKKNIDNSGNIKISLYDLRAAGIDSRNFEGYFDELANLISDKDLNAVKMYNEEVDEVTVAARTFRNLAINNVDVGAIEKPNGFVNLLQTGAVATLETLGMSKGEAEEFLTGTTGGTARTQIDNLDRAIKTANNTPEIQASMGGKIDLTEDQKENISMSMTEEVTSGIGGFVPDLMILGATGGVMNAMGYAKLISKMSPMARFITGAVVEEAKMQTILDMKPGGGATFYTLGAATSGIGFKKKFAWLDPLFQKVIKAGPVGAISAEGAGVAELAYESFMGDKNFKAEFDEMYKDFSTVSRRAIVNSMVFGLTGFTHVKRGDFMTTQRKYELVSELKNEVNNLMGQKLDFVDGFSSELKVDKDGVVIPDALKPKKQFKDLSPKDQKKFAEYTQRIQTLNQQIQAETMYHKLDPNSKNFEKDFDKMITEPMNRAMKALVPNFEGVKVKFGRRSDPKTPMFKKNFDSAGNTAQYNPKTKEMFFDLDAYTAGKPPHEFTHVALNAYLEANPGMKLNFTKNLGKVFEGFDFGEFEGTELAKRIKERYNIDLRTWKGKNLAAEEYLAFMGEFLADPKVYYSNPDLASTFMNQVRLEVKDFLVEAGLKTPNVKTAKDVVQLLGMIGEKTRMGGSFEVKMQTLAKLDEIDVIGAELVKANREAESKKVASKDLTKETEVVEEKVVVSKSNKEIADRNTEIEKKIIKAGDTRVRDIKDQELSAEIKKELSENNIGKARQLANQAAKSAGAMALEPSKRVSAEEFRSGYEEQLARLIETYKPVVDGKRIPFGAYMQKNLKRRYGQILQQAKRGKFEGQEKRLGQERAEGEKEFDIKSEEATPEEAIIASEERKAKVTPKSKVTRDFPEIFTEDLKNEIDKGLLEIFEGEIPGVETKEFKSFITEASRGKLTNKVKKALGAGKNYEFSIKKMAEKMKETLDPRFFVRLESQTKPENRIFTKPPRRLTKQAEIDAAMLNDKVYVENTAQGVNIYEFKDFTPKQLSDYILAPTISPTTGAKSGLRGTRKTAFAEGLVDRLTRDATPQNLKRIGKEPREIAEISKKMQVDPSTVMASKNISKKLENIAEDKIKNFAKSAKEILESANIKRLKFITEEGKEVEETTRIMKNFIEDILPKYLPVRKIMNSGALSNFGDRGVGNPLLGSLRKLFNIKGTRNESHNLSKEQINAVDQMATGMGKFWDKIIKRNNPKYFESKEFQKEIKDNYDGFDLMIDGLDRMIKAENYNPEVIQAIEAFFRNSSNSSTHPLRMASHASGYEIYWKSSRRPEREHVLPANQLGEIAFRTILDPKADTKILKKLVKDNYFQILINKFNDGKIGAAGYKAKMPEGYWESWQEAIKTGDINKAWSVWSRYFNEKVNKQSAIINGKETFGMNPNELIVVNKKGKLESLSDQLLIGEKEFGKDVLNPEIIAKQQELIGKWSTRQKGFLKPEQLREKLAVELDMLNAKRDATLESMKVISEIKDPIFNMPEKMTNKMLVDKANTFDKALMASRILDKKIKKARVFDFDDTVARTNSKVFAERDGKRKVLTAEQFAEQGKELVDAGWVMDFTDFNRVVEGKKGPLFELMKKMKEAAGDRDMFILTARAPESAPAIKEFLDAMGINIPLENITGLGNSTGRAKADWLVDKASEGYNDFYFADDAPQNVKAVRDALEVLDVKSKTQQAYASKDLSRDFNNLIEESTGIGAEKVFSDVKAQVRGAKAKRQRFFIPPSAEDMLGLVYTTLGKGKKGEAHLKFYQENLFDPYTRAMENLSTDRVNLMADFKALKKELDVPKDLTKKTESGFTNEQAVRVHLWNKMGEKIPGLSKSDLKELNDIVEKNPKLQAFADQILSITKGDGYSVPKESWAVGTITTDLIDVLNTKKRGKYLETWKQNKDLIYSKENLNKLEAAYGPKYRAALENSLRRMESGSNRLGGGNRLSNQVLDYINNSTGAIMFFNARSAVLQTISAANFINWGFNNPFRAGKAFANQPQYWKDFVELMNSDYLKDRRNGLKLNINESEIANAAKTSGNKAKAALNYILEKGYLPTKYADSFAIASGGATFYRNRINDLIKNEGKTEAEAKEIAMKEFRQVSEMSQQSSDPSKISQQQSSDLGRVVLQFANTPMQYARIQKRAVQDIVNGRGDLKTNISKIAYYGFLQNMLFNGLQQAVTSLGFGDEEMTDAEEKKLTRAVNGMLDSSLRGLGMAGVTAQVLKNLGIDIYDRSKRDRPEFTDSYKKLLEFSPAIKSKLGKFQSAAYPFDSKKRRAEVFEKGFSLDNPAYESMAKVITGTTNLPLDRLYSKINNLSAAMDEDTETWQSIAMVLGWPEWQIKGKQNYVEAPKTEEEKIKIKEERSKTRVKEAKGSTDYKTLKKLNKKEQIEMLIKLGYPKGKLRRSNFKEAELIEEIIKRNKKKEQKNTGHHTQSSCNQKGEVVMTSPFYI